ncbi:hypothetical protein IJH29_02455 [Candidatus Saccharibacteria bacterium]|nr:hypothetical protein [Candidatus Saccharibacteria bacterium]
MPSGFFSASFNLSAFDFSRPEKAIIPPITGQKNIESTAKPVPRPSFLLILKFTAAVQIASTPDIIAMAIIAPAYGANAVPTSPLLVVTLVVSVLPVVVASLSVLNSSP